MKKQFIILLILGLFLSKWGSTQPVNIGMSKMDVEKILGKPDLITTRDDLQIFIAPRPINMQRYKYKYEF